MVTYSEIQSYHKQAIIECIRELGNVELKEDDFYYFEKGVEHRESEDRVMVAIDTDERILPFLSCVSEKAGEITGKHILSYPIIQFEGYTDNGQMPNGHICAIDFIVRIHSKEYYYKEYLSSKIWREFRVNLLKQRGFNCEICKSKKNLQIHHLTYQNLGAEKDEDVIILCQRCHEDAHN